LLREENEDIVAAFLEAASGFALEDAGAILRGQGIELGGGTYFRTLPHLHHVDGFFAAVLVRTG
jgi:16S rRNA (cytosine967-C5)-methyltransferase